jgi:dTDP-glucose 4,6-dehydratase
MANTIMVTGAAGFIGSNFVRHWRAVHPQDKMIALDALTYAGTKQNLVGQLPFITFVHADIGDCPEMTRLLRRESVDLVVNFAAETHNSRSVLEPDCFVRTNVLGTQSLLEASRLAKVKRFHHVSTCEVYGDLPLDSPDKFTESSPYRPQTPYSASKAGADHIVRAYHNSFGAAITISNCANNYGPHQFPEKLFPLFITNALQGVPLPMYSATQNRREWIHVTDHCRAIELILDHGTVGGTYHVGTGAEASIEEIADLVIREVGTQAALKIIVADRPGHDRRYLLDCTKIRTELGWRPTVSFADGVRETVRWYRDNRPWWEPLLSRRPVSEDRWRQATPAPAS